MKGKIRWEREKQQRLRRLKTENKSSSLAHAFQATFQPQK